MSSTQTTSAYCARLKADLTGATRRSSRATRVPATTAKKACVPVAKMSANVSGTSVSVKECVLRRNSRTTGQSSVTRTMAPMAHQAISGCWIGSR